MQKIINFSGHTMSEKAMRQVKERFGEVEVVTLKVALYRRHPLFEQITSMLKNENLNNGEQPICVMPGLPIANSLVLSYIHGVSGMFPKVIELLRNQESGVYEVSEVYDLEYLRHKSRRYRN